MDGDLGGLRGWFPQIVGDGPCIRPPRSTVIGSEAKHEPNKKGVQE